MNRTTRERPAGTSSAAPPSSAEAGFSLLELLVASFTSLFVVGGMMVMLNGLQDVHRNTQEVIDAQQTARLSLEQMQRDLQLAGVGLAWLIPPFPLIAPRADGGIDIRHNQGGLTAALVADMAAPGGAIMVDDASGFQVDMTIALYDSGGAVDLVEIQSVDLANDRITHDGASQVYTVADGSAIARVEVISYTVQDVDGVATLFRTRGSQAPQPIAGRVADLDLTYYNDQNPPQVFNPTTIVEMLRIRTVEISLEIETQDIQLNLDERRSVTLTTRVTPRAVLLRGSNA